MKSIEETLSTRFHRRGRSLAVLLFPFLASLTAAPGFASEQFDQAHRQFQEGRSLQRLHQNTDASIRVLTAAYNGYMESVEQDPNGTLAARALYMSGSTKLFLGEPKEAISIYRNVADRYPQDRYYVAKSLVRMASVEKNILEADAARNTLSKFRSEFPEGAPQDLDREAGQIQKALTYIGKPAPPIAASQWMNGTPKESADRPKLTALYFFATWCPNCGKEVGFINDFEKRFQPKGMRLVGVTNHSKGQTDAILQTYIEKNQFRFPIAVDEGGQTSRAFGGGSVPTLVLVDRNDVIRWHDHPAALDYPVVETLLR